MRYPKPLTEGSVVAVTAPSNGVAPRHLARLEAAKANLRGRGWQVVEGRCLRGETRFGSASAAERAADFMELYTRAEVAAVFPPWGGEYAIDVLPLLDWEKLRQTPPKWVIGYSDTSTLLLPLTVLLETGTVHGINLMDSVAAQGDHLSRSLFEVLTTQPGDFLSHRQSERYQTEFGDIAALPEAPYRCDRPTEWRRLGGGGEARFAGRLIGGCLDTIACLTGTPFGRVPEFCHRHQDDGIIFYFEVCELEFPAMYRFIRNLRLAGWMSHLKGILIGRSSGPVPAGVLAPSYEEVLAAALGDVQVPVLYDVDIGHRPPQFNLVNGSMAIVKMEQGRGELIQQLI